MDLFFQFFYNKNNYMRKDEKNRDSQNVRVHSGQQ